MNPFRPRHALLSVLAALISTSARADTFKHPGVLHTADDFARMRAALAAKSQPETSGYEQLNASKYARSDYRMHGPFDTIARGPGTDVHKPEADEDTLAAYQNALQFAITGEKAHAAKATEILTAYARTLRRVGGKDVQLGAGFWGFNFASAAEILKYARDSGLSSADSAGIDRMLRDVFVPPIKDFATFANGNWDGACMKALIAIAVTTDDRALFGRVVDYYKSGAGNGRLTHYIINDAGQCQESGRDQAHTQLGLGLLCEVAEVAWNQGVDLYSLDDDRLLKGFEYTARYNLGEDVPFVETTDTTGKYHHTRISAEKRGAFRSVWELPYAHYHGRLGLPMPCTERVLQKIRPEGPPFTADHPGFGTILFYRPPAR